MKKGYWAWWWNKNGMIILLGLVLTVVIGGVIGAFKLVIYILSLNLSPPILLTVFSIPIATLVFLITYFSYVEYKEETKI
jgi:hypothetical protein